MIWVCCRRFLRSAADENVSLALLTFRTKARPSMTLPLEEVRLSKTDEEKDLRFYHYTSIDSFNSIFRSGKVWASDCRYLNDSHELAKAQELFLSKFEGKTREALSLAFHWHSFSRCHCVFSLSRSPEVLSQWRAYADDGKGVAIRGH